MSIRVERRGDKTTVETDYYDSFGTSHSAVYDDPQLTGGMKSFGIERLETRVADSDDARSALHEEFDRKFKEKYGREQGYFGL